MTATREWDVSRISAYEGGKFVSQNDRLVREIPLDVYLDRRRLVTIACAGLHVEELAVGFLRSEGMLRGRDDLAAVEVSPDRKQVWIQTSTGWDKPDPAAVKVLASSGSLGSGTPPGGQAGGPVTDWISLSPETILDLMERFLLQARLHEETGGTHAAALVRNGEILIIREDIGRHNAMDMLGGYALLHGLDCSDIAIFRTGRVSSEIVQKAWRLGVPLVCSLSVPTTQAVEMARQAGMTLVGAVRQGRMKIYCCSKEGRVWK